MDFHRVSAAHLLPILPWKLFKWLFSDRDLIILLSSKVFDYLNAETIHISWKIYIGPAGMVSDLFFWKFRRF